MKDKELQKAKELERSYEKLEKARRIFCAPYPTFFRSKIWFNRHDEEICFASFDEETCEGLKNVIRDYIENRQKEVRKELEEL